MLPSLNATELWLLSNGFAAVGFVALAVVLASRVRHGHRALGWLIAASVISAAWFSLLAMAPIEHIRGATLELLEALRTAAWTAITLVLMPAAVAQNRSVHLTRWIALVSMTALVAVPLLDALSLWTGGHVVFSRGGVVFMALMVVTCLVGLVLIESTYRASDIDARWAIKFVCIALATIFVYDFVLYSAALLTRRIPLAAWNVRGFVNLLIVPLIAFSAFRSDRWTTRVSVSQKALLSASALIGAGLYLTVMGVGSMVIRRFGGSWAEAAALLFIVAAILVLTVVLSSGKVRGTARVLMHKHLLSYHYDYREQWLALTRRLGRSDDGIGPHERAIRAVAAALDSPAGAVWVLREDGYVCAGHWNLAEAQDIAFPPDTELLDYLARTGWVIDIRDLRIDSAPYDGLVLPQSLDRLARARLIMPLFSEGTTLIGFMLLASPRAAFELGWEELDLLKAFGQQVGVYLDHEEGSRALTEARQFEAFNRLTAFLMHDLKNIAGQQSLIVQNVSKHRHNPAFIDDMIETVEYSVERMRRVLEQLGRVSQDQDIARQVDVDALVDTVIDSLANTAPAPRRRSAASGAQVHVDADRLGMVLRHLLRNAQDATVADGNVTVDVSVDARQVSIAVVDDGVGMTPAFIRDELFQPFKSTKSSRGMGIGAFQARDFARSCGGGVSVASHPGQGTRFTLWMPRVNLKETNGSAVRTATGETV